uniref:Ionotropic receptor n=1 Tax=Anopheles gambiae TaxID=7165 RepID=A0A2Y9D2F3_ANOGA
MEWICRLLSWQIAYWLCFPTHVICLLRSGSSESNLAPTIDAIVRLPRHRYLPNFSAEVCIVTTNVSTLSQTHPELIRLLNSQHPVKFATENPIKTAIKPRYANVVLLDVTGWEQFPVKLFITQFNENPCHFIDARFIVLVTRSCFFMHRSTVVEFLDDQGIVNYAIVPMPSGSTEPAYNLSVYTQNRYSKEQIFVKLGDLDKVHRLYPNKLTNLHGFLIRIGVDRSTYPYMMIWKKSGMFLGILHIMFREVGVKILNLNYSFFDQHTEIVDADAYFQMSVERKHFQHEFYFREMGGMCVTCPERLNRHFFPHLLKPLSINACIFLGVVFVVCFVLRLFFPFIFQHDLMLQIFFGAGGTAYHGQPFAARLMLASLSMLALFFSRRYLSRIIALMSLGRFYKRPNTMAEFKQSGYEFLVHPKQLKAFPLDDFRFMMLSDAQVERNRRVYGMYMHLYYCSMQECSDALLLASPLYQGLAHPFYVLKDKIIPLPYRLQFAKNSPLLDTFRRYFGLFYETGLWDFDINRHDGTLLLQPEASHSISGVVFRWDDLMSVWVLLVVGWLVGILIFVLELLTKKKM